MCTSMPCFYFYFYNSEHCCSPVSEPVWSAKDTLSLAIFFTGEFLANLTCILDLDTVPEVCFTLYKTAFCEVIVERQRVVLNCVIPKQKLFSESLY